MKTLKVGIASRDAFKRRTIAIAKGEYVPAKNEPKVWFESLGAMSQVLSDQNRALLKLIMKIEPQSLQELADRSGRAPSNLSRTLRNMERYGLVHFEQGPNRQLAPRVNYSGVELEMSFCKDNRRFAAIVHSSHEVAMSGAPGQGGGLAHAGGFMNFINVASGGSPCLSQ